MLSFLATSVRWLLELSLVQSIVSRWFYVANALISVFVGYYFPLLIREERLVVGFASGALTFSLGWALRILVESLYIGKSVREGVRKIKGRHAVLIRAYQKLTCHKFSDYGNHFTYLNMDGCPFDRITVDEQLAVIEACIEKALGPGAQGVKVYHIWNNEVFPIQEYWSHPSVKAFLTGVRKSYKNSVEDKIRLFVVDSKPIKKLKKTSAWTELKQYHHDNKIR
ncbi:hypothetical protein ES705_34422 [subsurface metagenome]